MTLVDTILVERANGTKPDANGETGEKIEYNLAQWMALSAFFAIAFYNVLELNISIFMTFKRRRGLYFWSLLASSWGVVFHELGFLLKLWQLTTNNYLSCTIITIGWWPMVTGQAIVLYSRLHLVVKEQYILKGVLAMICWNAVTLHIPTTVFTFGSSSPAWESFLTGFSYMERIQMTIFCIQEFIISGIYLWATRRLLRPIYRGKTRAVMTQLIWINIVIILMDVALLAEEYQNNYDVEAPMKGMVYSIKLKLEFAVLTQLMRLANTGQDPANLRSDEEKAWGEKKRQNPLRHLKRMRPYRQRGHDVEAPADVIEPKPPVRSASDIRSGSFTPDEAMKASRSFSIAGFGSIPNDPKAIGPFFNSRMQRAAKDMEGNGFVPNMYNNPAAFFASRRRRKRDPLDPLASMESSPGVSRQPTLRHTPAPAPTYFNNVDYQQTSRNSRISATVPDDDEIAPDAPISPTSGFTSSTRPASTLSPVDLTIFPLPPAPIPPTPVESAAQTPYQPTYTPEQRPQTIHTFPNTTPTANISSKTPPPPTASSNPLTTRRPTLPRRSSARTSFPSRLSALLNPLTHSHAHIHTHSHSTSNPSSLPTSPDPSYLPSSSASPPAVKHITLPPLSSCSNTHTHTQSHAPHLATLSPDPQLLRPSRPSVADWASTTASPHNSLSLTRSRSESGWSSDGASSGDSRTMLNPHEKAAKTLMARSRAVRENERIRAETRAEGEGDAEEGGMLVVGGEKGEVFKGKERERERWMDGERINERKRSRRMRRVQMVVGREEDEGGEDGEVRRGGGGEEVALVGGLVEKEKEVERGRKGEASGRGMEWVSSAL